MEITNIIKIDELEEKEQEAVYNEILHTAASMMDKMPREITEDAYYKKINISLKDLNKLLTKYKADVNRGIFLSYNCRHRYDLVSTDINNYVGTFSCNGVLLKEEDKQIIEDYFEEYNLPVQAGVLRCVIKRYLKTGSPYTTGDFEEQKQFTKNEIITISHENIKQKVKQKKL